MSYIKTNLYFSLGNSILSFKTLIVSYKHMLKLGKLVDQISSTRAKLKGTLLVIAGNPICKVDKQGHRLWTSSRK